MMIMQFLTIVRIRITYKDTEMSLKKVQKYRKFRQQTKDFFIPFHNLKKTEAAEARDM